MADRAGDWRRHGARHKVHSRATSYKRTSHHQSGLLAMVSTTLPYVQDSVPDSRDTKMDKLRAFYSTHQEDKRLQGGNFRNNSYITPTMCTQECQ